LCSWHVDKDLRKKLEAVKGEDVNKRVSLRSIMPENDLELSFIDLRWLEDYRQRRKDIVAERIAQNTSTASQNPPTPIPADRSRRHEKQELEPTVLNRIIINPIRKLNAIHLRWHPFKHSHDRVASDNGIPLTSRAIWLWQVVEMYELCKTFKEGYAWEYLWRHWYRWDKWKLWARAVNLQYYPTIQSNAAVEVHWRVIKNLFLAGLVRIRLDHLAFEIHANILPSLIRRTNHRRRRLIHAAWEVKMVAEWKKLEGKIEADDAADEAEDSSGTDDEDEWDNELNGDSQGSNMAADRRRERVERDYAPDIQGWVCKCPWFARSAYHLCKHLIRLYARPAPMKGQARRQHQPPLLFLVELHTEEQCHEPMPDQPNRRAIDSGASFADLGLSDEVFERLTQQMAEVDENAIEEASALAARKRVYHDFLDNVIRACNYAKEEVEASVDRFNRLPPPKPASVGRLVKYAEDAKTLDHGRKRRRTWGPERQGPNLFRN
jgi:hypothetical protein